MCLRWGEALIDLVGTASDSSSDLVEALDGDFLEDPLVCLITLSSFMISPWKDVLTWTCAASDSSGSILRCKSSFSGRIL